MFHYWDQFCKGFVLYSALFWILFDFIEAVSLFLTAVIVWVQSFFVHMRRILHIRLRSAAYRAILPSTR